jgi:hypothetical protein
MMKPLRSESASHFSCPLLAVMILGAAALPARGEPDAGAANRTNSAGKGAPARSRSVPARQVVQAEGIGRTLEEARRDAIRVLGRNFSAPCAHVLLAEEEVMGYKHGGCQNFPPEPSLNSARR